MALEIKSLFAIMSAQSVDNELSDEATGEKIDFSLFQS
jgi:hypothetical protein